MVGSGEHDLDATDEAFDLLERIVAGRLCRGLTTVVDTLGLDPVTPPRLAGRRPRGAGLPAVVVLVRHATCGDPPPQRRPRVRRPGTGPGPAAAGDSSRSRTELDDEGWDVVHVVTPDPVRAPRHLRSSRSSPPEDRRSLAGARRDAPAVPLPLGRGPGRLAPVDGAGGRRGRLRRARADGPPDPDPAGRPGLGADPRAVGHPRAARRSRHRACGWARWSRR